MGKAAASNDSKSMESALIALFAKLDMMEDTYTFMSNFRWLEHDLDWLSARANELLRTVLNGSEATYEMWNEICPQDLLGLLDIGVNCDLHEVVEPATAFIMSHLAIDRGQDLFPTELHLYDSIDIYPFHMKSSRRATGVCPLHCRDNHDVIYCALGWYIVSLSSRAQPFLTDIAEKIREEPFGRKNSEDITLLRLISSIAATEGKTEWLRTRRRAIPKFDTLEEILTKHDPAFIPMSSPLAFGQFLLPASDGLETH